MSDSTQMLLCALAAAGGFALFALAVRAIGPGARPPGGP